MPTPSERAIKLLRKLGYTDERVERDMRTPDPDKPGEFRYWKKDCLGFGDYLFMGHGRLIMLQVTSRSNVSSRVVKIVNECPKAKAWIDNGGEIIVMGFSDNNTDQPRVVAWNKTKTAEEVTALTYLVGKQEEALL